MACYGSTKCSPYKLVYGHIAILSWEIRTGLRCIEFQESLTVDDYKVLMMNDLEDLNCHRLHALKNIAFRAKNKIESTMHEETEGKHHFKHRKFIH